MVQKKKEKVKLYVFVQRIFCEKCDTEAILAGPCTKCENMMFIIKLIATAVK